MAIKGKTKRSQGRPVRRPAAGPRAQIIERRRQPWYKAPAFPATLAVAALLATLVVAYGRVQLGWRRDDVRRFTTSLQQPAAQLTLITSTGTAGNKGFAVMPDLASGKAKPAEVDIAAKKWVADIDALRQRFLSLTVTKQPKLNFDHSSGVPDNSVGGHVPTLVGVRDAYGVAAGLYGEAANAYQLAAEAPPKSKLMQQLVDRGNQLAQKASEAEDGAARLLAIVRANNRLDLTQRLPGESPTAYQTRYSKSSTPTPLGG